MKIGGNFFSFDICSTGLSLQRKRMELIAQNIANSETTSTENNQPYQRQFLRIKQADAPFNSAIQNETKKISLNTSNGSHIGNSQADNSPPGIKKFNGLSSEVIDDTAPGEMVYIPGHPDADKNGYVTFPNVNIITEMVDMISATRSYEANLTALNSAKQMAKDTLEI